MKNRIGLICALIPFILWGAGECLGGEILQVWPRQTQVKVKTSEPVLAGVPWAWSRDTLNIRFETKGLSGQAWRLWLSPHYTSSKVSPQVIRWEARPPLVSGRLAPNQRVLAGQGPIDGRPVVGNLVLWAEGEVPGAGIFPIQLEVILETLP